MGWEMGGGFKREGHMYTCDWFMLMYGRNQHNIVKQLNSKLKTSKNKTMNKKGKHEICSQKIIAIVKLKQNLKIKTKKLKLKPGKNV